MARISTLKVSSTPTLDVFVRGEVKSGAYESSSEVVRESLRMLQAVEKHERSFWIEVKQKVAVARRQVAEGRVIDGDQAMDGMLAELNGDQARKELKQKKENARNKISADRGGAARNSRYRHSHLPGLEKFAKRHARGHSLKSTIPTPHGNAAAGETPSRP